MKIKGNVHYVGVNDRTKTLFEGIWPLPYGVSYNSYLIADEKIALVDTVEVDFFERYLEKIKQVIGDKPIDYLIINHMEPDHSGSINLIRKYYPEITLVGNRKTFEFVTGFYGDAGNCLTVCEGDSLSLGHHLLRFYMVPMVHWPETMVSFDETEGILFSGDAFGCFGALNGGVLDVSMDTEHYWREMERYYSNIVGKYGSPVQKALQKLQGLDLKAIASTHGPVWTELIPRVVATYDRLSRYATEPGLVICYGSMYGNTELMAEAIAEGASEQGVKKIVMHDVTRTNHSYIIADVFRYNGLVVGAPTYNGALFPDMEALLGKIASRDIKGRYLGYFGGFSWAGQAVKRITELNERLKFEVVGTPVEMKHGAKPESLEQCKALGRAMADKILGK